MESNPCTDKLTDIEYLEHMIPHHQVAVDMCNLLLPETCDPQMLDLCRNIKRLHIIEPNYLLPLMLLEKLELCYRPQHCTGWV